MFGGFVKLACWAALLTGIAAGPAGAVSVSKEMTVGGRASAPVGYVAFCRAYPAQCLAYGKPAEIPLTSVRLRELEDVNISVNRAIAPRTDAELYHVEEYWTLPFAQGDCEDYVLLKRKELIERGWPSGALLITVVFDEAGGGHAVLVARTGAGDLVLDNKVDEIRPWYVTPYVYVKRQSVVDPNAWVSIGDPRWPVPVTAAPR
ncbi:transglutaminase-like cysteine peptidase [Propylenella binzhouense]|uniref:Transglutaminase n=1 Tax=Propylenella binzhouense TaxID=2555902 RepID=A0A964T3M0_9HYPH|nr:transglutaminase-like cysteine peptidase [Propylenella binzhouense]MYZ47833.1 transglutaminase [Propylenella binzhouense]